MEKETNPNPNKAPKKEPLTNTNPSLDKAPPKKKPLTKEEYEANKHPAAPPWEVSLANPAHREGIARKKAREGYQRLKDLDTLEKIDVSDVSAYARMSSRKVVDFLVSVVQDPEAKLQYRLSAANAVLDRGLGRPAQSQKIEVEKTTTTQKGLPPPTTQELEAMVAAQINEKVIN